MAPFTKTFNQKFSEMLYFNPLKLQRIMQTIFLCLVIVYTVVDSSIVFCMNGGHNVVPPMMQNLYNQQGHNAMHPLNNANQAQPLNPQAPQHVPNVGLNGVDDGEVALALAQQIVNEVPPAQNTALRDTVAQFVLTVGISVIWKLYLN